MEGMPCQRRYAQYTQEAEDVAAALAEHGIRALPYHAGAETHPGRNPLPLQVPEPIRAMPSQGQGMRVPCPF